MKSKYINMTKAELIKRINALEREKKKREKNISLNQLEELNKKLNLKEAQLENHKFELLNKQVQLEASRDKYADLYDFAPTGYATLNSSGAIKELNLTGAGILGVKTQNAEGIPFVHFLVKEEIQKFLSFIRKCKKSTDSCVEEFTLANKKNEKIVVQVTALVIHDYISRKKFFRLSISDISQRKKAEIAMVESEERFRLMANASPSLIWMTNSQNQLEYMNQTKLDFLGKQYKELKDDGWIKTRHPDDREKFVKEFSEAVSELKTFSTEVRIKNRDGEYRWLFEEAAPRFLKDGTFVGYIGSAIDVTDKRNARIKLEKSLKEKEILLKEIHHRVKNNLQIISSLLNLQRGYITDKKTLNIFRSSQSRISAMALLHEKLYGSENLTYIDFKDYINSITKSLLDTYRNSVQDVKINLNIDNIPLNIDTSINLGLIVNELVSNSLKYAFSGKEEGEINITLNKKDDEKLILKVSDNGIGLPQNFNMTKRKSLGLELVSNIVEQLQGELEISKNGRTEFRISVSHNFSFS